ncbi:hypothetical protein BB734_14910 [Mycobacterium avium subsp. hominissuis]|uniref:Uncharacterized protein n=1 Tax=Mycobacterium avium TaxID=1764 RepID=A0A2A2ZCH1_MYCAV|nr:hypothetical protein CKJ66_24060 [Mycobacterium avium]PBD11823.1 hypothetical protein BI295_17920 [Mycobacterium avium subsp. hominissuis]PBA39359.1 hypothetical protein CKJ63_22480 [Mycobacterium avium]PBA64948.1 hypothetical protein CKJ55_21675 [Mycobacterium avium]PBJ52612.1 hypothetical protein BB734_14910 [Mycobacterium avium subsp. hominissuis]
MLDIFAATSHCFQLRLIVLFGRQSETEVDDSRFSSPCHVAAPIPQPYGALSAQPNVCVI